MLIAAPQHLESMQHPGARLLIQVARGSGHHSEVESEWNGGWLKA
jgi:hypothetical protein